MTNMRKIDRSSSGSRMPAAPSSNPSTASSRVEALAARGRTLREASGDDVREKANADWFDTDPSAAMSLPSGRHPVDLVLSRRRGGAVARRNARYRIRWTLAVLQGKATSEISEEHTRAFAWHHISPEDAFAFRNEVIRRYEDSATRNALLDGMRSMLTACTRAHLISHTRRDQVIEELEGFATERTCRGRLISQAEMATIMASNVERTTWEQARSRALIGILATNGLRISEVLSLSTEDWDQSDEWIHVRRNKNGRPYAVPVHPTAAALLREWVELRGDWVGPLFPATRTASRPLSYSGFRVLLRRRVDAGPVRPCTAHDFRRTFATMLLRSHDPALVSRLLNHTSLNSTLTYDLSDEVDQRNAVNSLPLPTATPLADRGEEGDRA